MTRLRVSCLVVLVACGSTMSAAVSRPEHLPAALCPGSLFGPESFSPRRAFITNPQGAENAIPVPERGPAARGTPRKIALQGHTPPFVLRARSGDTGSRVQVAWVWLDGQQVLGPDDFSLEIVEHERVVEAREGSVLRVEVVDPPGSTLSVEIVGGRPDTEQIVLTPDGGHYELESGAVLDVPPGAVDQTTRIAVCGVSATSAQPRLDANVLQPQYFAAGIQGVPSGLTFNVPVTVTMPSAPRRSPDDGPVAFTLKRRGGAFSLAPTDLQYDPTSGLIRARMSHFSESVYAYAESAITKKYDCRDKANWCYCYGHIEAIESSSDSMVGDECYVTGSAVLVTYLECPGQPQDTFRAEAKEVPTIEIQPPSPHVTMCDAGLQLTAVGIHRSEPKVRPVLDLAWESSDKAIASVDSSGFVRPGVEGCVAQWSTGSSCFTQIYANGSCGAYNLVQFDVLGPRTVDPLAPPPTLTVGQTHLLTALARDINGTALGCEPIEWSSSNENVATVIGGVLKAEGPGEAVVTARARHNATAEETVRVKVRPSDECDQVACTLMVGVAVQPTVERCSGTANACVYTGGGGLHLSAWMRNDSTGKKVKRELAWAAVPMTGSVELAPAVDPDPAVTRVQVKGFVPGMVTMQAFDPSSALSATLKVHVVPWLFQATTSGTRVDVGFCHGSGWFEGVLTVRLPGAWPCWARWMEFKALSGWYEDKGSGCYVTGPYLPEFCAKSPFTVSGSSVRYHWEEVFGEGLLAIEDLDATFDDTGMSGTFTQVIHGGHSVYTDTIPSFYLGAVAVKP